MRTRKFLVAALALAVFAGCKKKQNDPPTAPKPPQAAAPAASASAPTPSPGAPSASSGEANPPAKLSEQQERALRRYNENAWFIQQAMQLAPADETLTAGISKMVKAATPDWDHANPSHWEIRGPEVAARLRPWLAMAQKLEPPKQAAALLIADRIMVMEEEDGNLEPPDLPDNERPATEGQTSVQRPKSSAQLELEKLSARFTYEAGSERYFYELNWLQKAYELDPKGQAGDLAFLALMKRGFDTSQSCANGSEQFREVIRRGTEFLREHHNAEVQAQVHFTMGDAYRDIVALAEGLQGDNYVDPNTYKPEAPAARTKAIAEYRVGLALDGKSETSLLAKEQLRSLEAGEVPHYARFYCQLLD